MANKPTKYPTRVGKLLARAAPIAVNRLLPVLPAITAGRMIGHDLNVRTPIQKYIAKGVDKATGLDAKVKKALADTPIPARKSAGKPQSAATKTKAKPVSKRKGGTVKPTKKLGK